jgi:2-polyprenyl-3-methyl-5-hydroxy-6-metoxy-1,4-benzoquinol methylase
MMDKNILSPTDLHEKTQQIWDQNASFWDDNMRDGNAFQNILIEPACERLLALQAGETVLEIGCGNGVFARRMAQLGARVIATDFSAQLLDRARARTNEHTEHIEYQLVDGTREDQILALGLQRFDAAVCNQAIMDMTEIDPLMRGIRQVVKPGGRFVFSICHPCFNHSGISLSAEETTVNGEIVSTYAVKVSTYLNSRPQKGVAILGQPVPQYYFDRPLHVLFNSCFRAGLVLDGLEEPAFNPPQDSSQVRSAFSWTRYDVPPILIARLRIPN